MSSIETQFLNKGASRAVLGDRSQDPSKRQRIRQDRFYYWYITGYRSGYCDRLMQGTGITNARWQTLSELFALEKPVTVSELARYMGLTRQAIQRLADDMASDGLVEFAANPSNARAMHLLLTEPGKAACDDALEREWQWANAIAKDFDAEQIACAVTFLEVITQKIQIGT
jgi:DNA-binding MarR family transcriptional regulator